MKNPVSLKVSGRILSHCSRRSGEG